MFLSVIETSNTICGLRATLGTGESQGLLPRHSGLPKVLGAVGQRLPAEEGEIEIDDDEYEEMVEGGAETGIPDLSQLAGYGQGRGEEGQDQVQSDGFNALSNRPIHPPTQSPGTGLWAMLFCPV